MMKKIVYLVLIIAAISLAFYFIGNRATQDKGLAKEINALLEKGETQIDLIGLTNFKWAQVSVFEPYTADESIEDSMDIHFKGDNGGIDMLDDRFLMVFSNEKHAIKTVVLSRKYGSYTIKENRFLVVDCQHSPINQGSPNSKQAKKNQKWQLPYFIEMSNPSKLLSKKIIELYSL